MNYFPILLMVFFLWTCQSNSSEQPSAALVENLNGETAKIAIQDEPNIDSQWIYLTFEKGGCLTGGQRIRDGKFGGPECVMSRSKDWKTFFNRDQEELHSFLLSKLADTTTTKIHTCPFFNASVGEVAVYSLQNLYKTNWYDFEQFESYKTKEATSEKENQQVWLQSLLEEEVTRDVLIKCWNEKAGS